MPSALSHDPAITVPGASTDNAIVIFDGTGGTGFGNSTILVDSGGNGRIGIATDTNIITLTNETVAVAGAITGVTALTVDNININGNTISSTAGTDLLITPLAGQQLILDGTIIIDAGVVTGATSITSTEFVGGGVGLTALNGTQITTGTVADARISALTASKLTGALPAISGANLTNLPAGGIASLAADTTPQVGGSAGLDLQAQLLVGNGGSTGIAISANGEVTMAAQPAFAAHQSSNVLNVTGNGTAYTAVFPTEVYDQNSDFSSPTFTAPVTGKYVLTSSLRIFGNTTAISYGVISLVTSNRTWNVYTSCVSAGDTAGFFISAVADMDAADTCQVRLTIYGESSDLCDISGSSSMSIHFAGILVA